MINCRKTLILYRDKDYIEVLFLPRMQQYTNKLFV